MKLRLFLFAAILPTVDARPFFCQFPFFEWLLGSICDEDDLPKCEDLVTEANKFGEAAKGVDLREYTDGTLEWIGCFANRGAIYCMPSEFRCSDTDTSVTFGIVGKEGADQRTLVSLVDVDNDAGEDGDPGELRECAEPDRIGISHPPHFETDVDKLCKAMGYSKGSRNWAPVSAPCDLAYEVEGLSDKWNLHEFGSAYVFNYTCEEDD